MAKMEAYERFEFEQFIEDPQFRHWVFSPTEEEQIFWQNFLTIYPHKQVVVQEARTFLQGTIEFFDRQKANEQQFQERLENVLERVDGSRVKSDQIIDEAVTPGDPRLVRKQQRFQASRIAIAASIVLLLAFGGWFFTIYLGSTVYTTNFGEWKTIELPDGTTVQLNANSRLSRKKNWEEGDDRVVYLKGEAFFTVMKKPETGASFTVITPDLEVEVLGTAFNIHTRGESTEVYLQEGKVRLDYGEDETLMEPGDFVAYSAEKDKITARHTHDQEEVIRPDSWKDGVLMFRKEYAFPILEKIEEIYGVEIEVKDASIYTKKYNVAVPMKDLSIVIPTLEKSMNVIVNKQNNLLILE